MKKCAFSIGLAMVICAAANAAVWYVDGNNISGVEDGTTWATALTEIQAGIDAAFDDGGGEVWVAQGVYDEERANDDGSLIMKEGVHLYGGFAGMETLADQREWETYVTTIDGSSARAGEVAYHVVVGADNATLDGFTITGGNANGDTDETRRGGGMLNYGASPAVANCIFAGNSADDGAGGAMFNDGSSPTIFNCAFAENSAYFNGGAMFNTEDSSPILFNCAFCNNVSYARNGGAIFNARHSLPTLINCLFSRNSSDDMGGAIVNSRSSPEITECVFIGNSTRGYGGAIFTAGSEPVVTNCLFEGNSAGYGAGMYNFGLLGSESYPVVANCTFTENSASRRGGGIYNAYTSLPRVTNCILWNDSRGEIHNDSGSTPTVTYSDVEGSYPGEGNINADPLFVGGFSGASTDLTYDSSTFKSVLMDSAAVFVPDRHVGAVLWIGDPGTEEPYYITDNDATTITVWGDATQGGTVASPVVYAVMDCHLRSASPCIDAGRDTSGAEHGNVITDFEGDARGYDGDGLGTGTTGDGSDYDIGADEFVVKARMKNPCEGKRIAGNRVTLMAEIIQGEIEDVENVLFQYRLTPSENWLNIPAAGPNHPNPDTGYPYLVHWDVTGLPSPNACELRAVATSTKLVADPHPASIMILIDHAAPG